MNQPPSKLKHAKVMRYAIAAAACRPSGSTKRLVDGTPLFVPAALAVVHFELSQGGVYLYYCDRCWRVLKENWHHSISEAIERANYEFDGLQWLSPG